MTVPQLSSRIAVVIGGSGGIGTNAKFAAGIPLKRIAAPEDVADAILACATLLRYSTGSTILVDGGRAL